MGEFAKHVPDVTTFATNVVVFLAAIGAAVAGSFAMVKKIKVGWDDTFAKGPNRGDVITQREVTGALLMETTTAAMLSSSQKMLCEQVSENSDEVKELRHAILSLRDEMRELRHELGRRRDV